MVEHRRKKTQTLLDAEPLFLLSNIIRARCRSRVSTLCLSWDTDYQGMLFNIMIYRIYIYIYIYIYVCVCVCIYIYTLVRVGNNPSRKQSWLKTVLHFRRTILKAHLSKRRTSDFVDWPNGKINWPRTGRVMANTSKPLVFMIRVLFWYFLSWRFNSSTYHLLRHLTFCLKIKRREVSTNFLQILPKFYQKSISPSKSRLPQSI